MIIAILSCSFHAAAQYGFDTIQVYFDIGKYDITLEQARTLDSVYELSILNERKMLIYGYADYLGVHPDNQTLSDKRAIEVNNYFLQKGLPPAHIIQYTGVGQVNKKNSGEHGNADFRKVDIFLKKSEPQVDGMTFYINDMPAVSDVKPIDASKEFVHYHKISQLEVGQTFILKNINFLMARSTIEPKSIPYLQELLALLKAYPQLKIKLEGHVCCIDNNGDSYDMDRNNQTLSLNRAEVIYRYLIANGIDKERLSYVGFGKRFPIFPDEDTDEKSLQNRRVEVRIMAK